MKNHDIAGTGVENVQRLTALHRLGLLDSQAEPAFDRLTQLVSRLLHVPVALVSLLDSDRQFFKSAVGLPEPWATRRETPLSHSFCQYVVETGEPLIVNDAPNHPLVCTNLAIPDLNVQAYLGIPLMTSDGMVLGSLCAIDDVPRAWNQADIATVRDLAASVVTEIELRRDILARQQAEAALNESNARFSGAFGHAPIGMALVGPDGKWLQVNPTLCGLLGYTAQELLKLRFQDLTHPTDLATDLDYLQQMLRGESDTHQMQKRYFRKDGQLIWVSLHVSLVRNSAGQPQYFISQTQDITQQRQDEHERQQLIEQLSAALDERDGLLQHVNAALDRTAALYAVARTLNHTQSMAEILQTVVESAARVLPANRTVLITFDTETRTVTQQTESGPGKLHIPQLSFDELWDGLTGVIIRTGEPVRSLKTQLDPRESQEVQERRTRDDAGSILVVPIQSQGTILGTLTAINTPAEPDFSAADMELLMTLGNQAAVAIERATLLHKLEHRAAIDGLTQLLNRRAWFEQSERIMAMADRHGWPLSVVMLDVDYFKRINDTYGHAAGDKVLQTLGQTLQHVVRRSELVGRYGGEEFVILLPETDGPTALRMAERIRRTIAALRIDVGEQQLAITISLGVATTERPTLDLTSLADHADHALYAAKHAGRNCSRRAPGDRTLQRVRG